jgi:hypothetical protein
MKKIVSLAAAVLFITTAFAQKTINDPNAEKRSVSGFHAIHVSGGIDLYLSQGDEAVAVSATETKYRDRIKTEVKDGVLKIWYEYENKHISISWGNRKLKAYVSCKTLDGLKGSGGSDIQVEGIFKTTKLNLDISGGSDFNGKVEASELKAGASGGSDIVISGIAKSLHVDVSGGSDFKGFDLVTENCYVDASGGSDVNITVNKELSVESSGGSDVHYKGAGLIRDIKNSGGGSVKKISK